MTEPIPVTLISGYLGAGKTTLVNQMLRQAEGNRIAVLVNEFGELPIDEDLIEARDDEMIAISGGCICCSFGSDLTAALQKMSQMQPRPDHVVIEASGVALPGAIAQTVDLLDVMRMEGICVLVDGLNIKQLIKDEYIGDTIERQLNDADLLVISKSDLLSDVEQDALCDWLSAAWPAAPCVIADHGQVPNAVLLGAFSGQHNRAGGVHADGLYASLVLRFDHPVAAEDLARRLQDPRFGIVRSKGFVRDHSGKMALIQLAGKRSDVTYPEAHGDVGVICIGLRDRFDVAAIRTALDQDHGALLQQ